MNRPRVCPEIEMDLIAAATGDADRAAVDRVERHVGTCRPCRDEYASYRALDAVIRHSRHEPGAAPGVHESRRRVEARLEALRRRALTYRIFPSPLGNILIALSDRGVSLVEYLGNHRDLRHSRLQRLSGVEVIEDGAEVEAYYRELLDYLEGRRARLEWPLDLRLVRSDFHRTVLQATAHIPFGAVASYAGVACEVGKPRAVRAVAQALRWNPLPIVIPCHRVIGSSGALTGYAGNKVEVKQRLLAREGVPVVAQARDLRVARDAMYVAGPDSREYCLPTCDWLARMDHPNRLRLFGSRAHAEAAGLAPCQDCRPDLHPLAS